MGCVWGFVYPEIVFIMLRPGVKTFCLVGLVGLLWACGHRSPQPPETIGGVTEPAAPVVIGDDEGASEFLLHVANEGANAHARGLASGLEGRLRAKAHAIVHRPWVEPLPCKPWPNEAEVASKPVRADRSLPVGVAAMAVRQRSAVIWTRTHRRTRLRVHYSAGPQCPQLQSEVVISRARDGFSAELPLDGLRPGTRYRYQVEVVGRSGMSSHGWFVTAPAGDKPARLAFSADVSGWSKSHGLLPALMRSNPDLYLSLGDWPYADSQPPAESLDEFRQKHVDARSAWTLQRWMRSMAVHAVWDDHEVMNDWDRRDLWEQRPRVRAGMRAWREFFAVRSHQPGLVYRRYMWGSNVEIFQLDCRAHRSANSAPDGPKKTMLGKDQLSWLLQGLSESRAAFKLIVTSVPLGHGTTGKDHWEGFAHERDLLLEHIVSQEIGGVVFLTADQHWFSVHHLPQGPKMFQVGPLAQFLRQPSAKVPPWVLMQMPEVNFGLVDYHPGAKPSLEFTAVGQGGELYREVVPAGRGRLEVSGDKRVPWRLDGAHVFVGQGPKVMPWATPGAYQLMWFGPDGPTQPRRGVLVDGEVLLLEVPSDQSAP